MATPVDPPPAPADALTLPVPPLFRPELGFALRPWGAHPDDAIALARGWADPEVVRWTSVPAARSVDDAARWIGQEGARRVRGMAIDLVIAAPDDPAEVRGEVGFAVADPARGWAEIGYWLFPEARRQGVASAAVGVFSDWTLRSSPVTRLAARTLPENPASGRVLERAGYTRAGQMDDGVVVWVLDEPSARFD